MTGLPGIFCKICQQFFHIINKCYKQLKNSISSEGQVLSQFSILSKIKLFLCKHPRGGTQIWVGSDDFHAILVFSTQSLLHFVSCLKKNEIKRRKESLFFSIFSKIIIFIKMDSLTHFHSRNKYLYITVKV